MRVVLASKSPRRSLLLRELGIKNLEVIPSRSEEEPDLTLPPRGAVERIALAKARDVSLRADTDALVIAADTLVYLDGAPMGKPGSEEEARAMLRSLSGREHTVVTGIALILGGRTVSASEETLVRFRPLSEREIDWYVSTGEPMDKAGAYGAQGKGSVLVEGITGDFFNVMGLPMCRLAAALGELGIEICDLVSKE